MSEGIVPVSDASDSLDAAGRTILGLLHRAADVADANSQRALDMAHKLSVQLRAAEAQIKQLEEDAQYHQERADRAERWLQHISAEFEQRFFDADDGRRAQIPSPKGCITERKDLSLIISGWSPPTVARSK
jgi:hypothetical protein